TGLAGKPITIIVDRGFTMSALSDGQPRFIATAREAGKRIATIVPPLTPVDLIAVPGEGARHTTAGDWAGTLRALSRTALDTRAALRDMVRDRLAGTSGPVIVISDQRLDADDARVVQFAPQGRVADVAISLLSARAAPTPQVMVRVRNDSDRRSAAIEVQSAGRTVRRTVDLPERGARRDFFLDLESLGSVVEASIDATDDQPANDRAWLVREGSNPKLEARAPLPAELQRMIQVYGRSRPPTEASSVLAIVADEARLPRDGPAIWIAPSTGSIMRGETDAIAHPVTANIDWRAFPREARLAGEPPKGWKILARLAGRPILAVRSEPVRRVWVGFDAGAWSGTTDFVVFWANVLSWAGASEERFAGYSLDRYEPGWKQVRTPAITPIPAAGEWPGLYQSPEGGQRAFNAPDMPAAGDARTTANWRKKLSAALGNHVGGWDVSPLLLVLAVAGLAGAAATWKRRNLTPVSAGRTF
ncbi:MAG TPA: hypothetical protein VFC78_05605, partial [Tepidisphaeraceae bacterium]|nr:hypothetical protein [Tepidisphaeraceae bacterium]